MMKTTALALILLVAPALFAAPPTPFPLEARRVNGTNYNLGILRTYLRDRPRPHAALLWTRDSDRPLPGWLPLSGEIKEERRGALLIEVEAFAEFSPRSKMMVAVRGAPLNVRKEKRFNDLVCETGEFFQYGGGRITMYDFGKVVPVPAEWIPSAEAVAAAKKSEADAKAKKQAGIDAEVKRFRDVQKWKAEHESATK